MKTVLITGDTGLLGRSLAVEASKSHRVFGVSRGETVSARWEHCSVDLTDADTTLRYLNAIRPDAILHCAALTDVEQCEKEPSLARAVNVDATETLTRWAGMNRSQFVFISTDSVFDGFIGEYREEDPTWPLNQYAQTKLAGERLTERLSVDSLIVRTNFYGWNRNGRPNLGRWMHEKLARGETFSAFTDVRFNPLFVDDLAKLILDLMSREAKGVFHAGARNVCSKYEFAFLLGRAFGFDTRIINPILLEHFPFAAERPRNTSLETEKCAEFLGREMPTVNEGIMTFARALAKDSSASTDALAFR